MIGRMVRDGEVLFGVRRGCLCGGLDLEALGLGRSIWNILSVVGRIMEGNHGSGIC